jgi:TolB-like protein/Tfp pilus assembly protein PilF
MKRLFAELRRRNVIRATILYVGAVWALAQGVAQLGPAFGMPDWGTRWFVIAGCVGFPFWVAFAWFFELTPSGLKRESKIAPDESIVRSTSRKIDFAIIGVLAVAVVLLLTDRFVGHKSQAAPIDTRSIAVLPFENMSADAANAYFADGMQDLILTKLADIAGLRVISRTSTQKYKSRPDNLRQVAAELGVATLLEGSVQRAGNDVLINVQLIDARDDKHLWAESYQRTLDNIFGVEGEVAQKIADELTTKLTAGEAARLREKATQDAEALDLYLRAEFISRRAHMQLDSAQMRLALPLYEQAIAKDPTFALAFARLSYIESLILWLGAEGDEASRLTERARKHAQEALALQPKLPDAHIALGYCEYYGKQDYEAALTAFRRALTERPNDADAMAAIAYVLRRQGRFDDAIHSLENALERDPRNTNIAYNLGGTLTMVRQYAQAQRALERAIEIDPGNTRARFDLTGTLLLAGEFERALASAEGDEPIVQGQRALILFDLRRYRDAIALMESIENTPDNFPWVGGPKSLTLAALHAVAGDGEQAQTLYAKALAELRKSLDGAGTSAKTAVLWSEIADAELGLGHTSGAMDAIAKAQSHVIADAIFEPVVTVNVAMVAARAGRADIAVPLLDHALSEPGGGQNFSPAFLAISRDVDPIRHDARFIELAHRYHIDPEGRAIADAALH